MDAKIVINLVSEDALSDEDVAAAVREAMRDGITPEEWVRRVVVRGLRAARERSAETPKTARPLKS